MRLEIRCQGLELDHLEQAYIERRLQFALSRFALRIRRVTVFVADQNGPKGGLDKRCRLVVNLMRMAVITVEDQDAELTAAIDRGADRLTRSVQRAIDRKRTARFDRNPQMASS